MTEKRADRLSPEFIIYRNIQLYLGRLRLEFSLADLEERSGVSKSAWGRMLRRPTGMTVETLGKVAEALECRPADLLNEEGALYR